MKTVRLEDLQESIASALQYVSHHHPPDYIRALKEAYVAEENRYAKNAILQILINSKLSATARRPICQDTGIAHVFMEIGMDVRFTSDEAQMPSLQEVVDNAVIAAYTDAANPLRATTVREPLGTRKNTGNNSPGVLHITMCRGDSLRVTVSAKGGGGDVKARFAMLNPSESVEDWVLEQMPKLGAGWCPPGVLGVGLGGSPEQAMQMAKASLHQPIDIHEIRDKADPDDYDQLRLSLYDRINNELNIGAQGLGGMATVLDIKLMHAPCHAAMLPVAIVPNCAATRYITFELEPGAPAQMPVHDAALWEDIPDAVNAGDAIAVNLDTLTLEEVRSWKAGDLLLLSGTMLTARDAAHKRIVNLLRQGQPLPVDFRGRAVYYVGPVDAVGDEVVGSAGPTTSNRMDAFLEDFIEKAGLLVSIGKAERSRQAIDVIKKTGTAYLSAVGGAAYLISKTITRSRVVAFEDLGMEAIYEFEVRDFPVVVAIDSAGGYVHKGIVPIVREESGS